MINYTHGLLLVLIFVMPGWSYEHPGGLYSAEHLALVKQQVQAGREPWNAGYSQLVSLANSNLSRTPQAVAILDVPGYYRDPDGHRAAMARIGGDAFAAYSCALVYQLGLVSNRNTYAEKARQMINAWATINKGVSSYDGPLVFSNSAVALTFSAELISDYSGWSTSEQNVFKTWLRNVYKPIVDSISQDMVYHGHNNWGSWGTMAAITASHFLDDSAAVADNIIIIKERIEESIEPDGEMPAETTRGSNGIWYTYFSLAPLTQACQIAYNATGTDLFSYVPADGAGLKKALDYLMYYCLNPGEWPHYDGTLNMPKKNDWPANLFEAMYGVYRETSYNEWVKNNRPLGKMGHNSFGWTFSTLMRPPDR